MSVTEPNQLRYPFVVVADPDDGTWLIMFPDLPGCMTHADTWEDVGVQARDALMAWVQLAQDHGDPIPRAGETGTFLPDWAKGVMPSL